MNESAFNLETSEETSLRDDAPPEFGLVDIVEAFTAMRHEWRGQIKESRAVAESVHSAVAAIQDVEAKLLAHTADGSTDEARELAELIADIDHQLTRSVAAAEQSEWNRRRREESDTNAIKQYFEGMNAVARWFARPLLTFVTERCQARDQTNENPAIEGLKLLLARLRRMMKERHIERIETLGQVFDANTMHAVGTVDTVDFPSGHVAEQLSPCYRWHGRLLRFADVRVATQRASEDDSQAGMA